MITLRSIATGCLIIVTLGSTIFSACGGDTAAGSGGKSTTDSGKEASIVTGGYGATPGDGAIDSAGTGGKKEAGGGGKDAAALGIPPTCILDLSAVECNPVTAVGCTGDGVTCDFSDAGFTCYDPPNDQDLDATCNGQDGPYCKPTLTCYGDPGPEGVCKKFCCSNADCNGEPCIPFDPSFGTIGVCLSSSDGGAESGTDGASSDAPGSDGSETDGAADSGEVADSSAE